MIEGTLFKSSLEGLQAVTCKAKHSFAETKQLTLDIEKGNEDCNKTAMKGLTIVWGGRQGVGKQAH